MPTILLIDVSLSMTRPVPSPEGGEGYQRRHLAIHGLNTLLDFMAINYKLEFTALVAFSSLWELVVPFTRDFDNIKSNLNKLEDYERTCIQSALQGVSSVILEEWGAGIPCQIVLVTDGNIGIGPGSLKQFLNNARKSKEKFPLPFQFPSKLHILCISNLSDPSLHISLPLYQKLIEHNNNEGQLFTIEGPLSLKSVQQMFTKLAEAHFAPFYGVLHCGNLKSHIQLSPPPEIYDQLRDFELIHSKLKCDIEVVGFLDSADVSSPPVISRHLVLPSPTSKEEHKAVTKSEVENSEEEATPGVNEDGKTPSFCVLMHGSLKVEGMVAICQVGEDWFGMLYSWADSKKKSNLMLSLFEPGINSVPWLGPLNMLCPISDFPEPPYGDDDCRSPFPVKPSDKRSYAQNCVVWIRQSGLQADIQKILRHARKLPDKQQNFYKELNRLRKAALSFGFHELLVGMSAILERECTLLPGTAHPDAALQLTHASNALRKSSAKDINTNILPLRTNFVSDD